MNSFEQVAEADGASCSDGERVLCYLFLCLFTTFFTSVVAVRSSAIKRFFSGNLGCFVH